MDNNFEIKDNRVFFNKNNFNTCELLAMIDDNILIKMSGDYEQYAIGVGFNFKTKDWNWGHYFDEKRSALDYFIKNYIIPTLEDSKEYEPTYKDLIKKDISQKSDFLPEDILDVEKELNKVDKFFEENDLEM